MLSNLIYAHPPAQTLASCSHAQNVYALIN